MLLPVARAQVQVGTLQLAVKENNLPKKLAWAGGLQAPQFSKIDLNADGISDLFVFDRYDNRVLPFINNGTQTDTAYTYAPEYAVFFPEALHSWVLLEDYNCDGKADIFTAGETEDVAVYLNTSTGSQLSFQLAKASLSGSNGPITVASGDIPSISDVDNDGDLDLLFFPSGSDFVSLFRNMRVENGRTCQNDILQFQRQTRCWGLFEENFFNSNISLGVGCNGNRTGNPANLNSVQDGLNTKTMLHAGSTLLVLDTDGDGDKEALIGDISGSYLTFLQNGGTNTAANMTSQTNSWPAANPVSLFSFPAAFYLDVDNDNLKDLLVAPNTAGEGGGKNFENVLFYKNTGTNAAPNFTYQKNNFLSGQMIETGAGAAPAFFDFDNDGKQDLVIGTDNATTNATTVSASLTLYRNIGSATNPVFDLVTSDFAAIQARNLRALAPTFGDLDGDNDMDMLLGESLGFVYYFRNDAAAGQPASFTFVSNNYLNQSVGAHSTPQLIDIDRDGDLDMLVGERNGNINFFRNTGTVSAPNFSLVTTTFGNISVRNPFIAAGYATLAVGDLNSNNNYDLLVGDFDGNLHYFPDFETNLTGTFSENTILLANSLAATSDTLKPGRRTFPAMANLTSDNLPDIVTGLGRGGLLAFQNQGMVSGINETTGNSGISVQVYPNPFSGEIMLMLPEFKKINISITDLSGRELYQKTVSGRQKNVMLPVSFLPVGMFLLTVSTENEQPVVRKILKIK